MGISPPRRYRTTLEMVEARFVVDGRFAASRERLSLFNGLLRYLTD